MTLKNRRMGVALARGASVEDAVERCKAAAAKVRIRYGDQATEAFVPVASADQKERKDRCDC
jgi:hypothetical protein